MSDTTSTGCCPRFDPAPWDRKVIEWNDKLFIKDRITSVFHIPLNFGSVMVRNFKLMTEAGCANQEALVLCDENSMWGADVYISCDKPVPGAQMATLSGTYMTRVFEGPYSQVRNWVKEMISYVKSENKEPKRLLFYYTTCPKCAKAYNKNYVVILAQI